MLPLTLIRLRPSFDAATTPFTLLFATPIEATLPFTPLRRLFEITPRCRHFFIEYAILRALFRYAIFRRCLSHAATPLISFASHAFAIAAY